MQMSLWWRSRGVEHRDNVSRLLGVAPAVFQVHNSDKTRHQHPNATISSANDCAKIAAIYVGSAPSRVRSDAIITDVRSACHHSIWQRAS